MQEMWEMQVQSLGQEDLLEEGMQPTPAFLPGNPVERGTWRATAQRVAESRTRLTRLSPAKTDVKRWGFRGFPYGLGLRLCTPLAGGPGSIPGQGTRSHMPDLQPSMAK